MGISNSIKMYSDLSNTNKSSDISSTISGMKNLADGYEILAKGISSLNREINKIDTDKLIALKNLTGSIVLLSLMDSEQFEKMMNALEDKAKIFVDVMNDIDGSSIEVGKGSKAASLSTINTISKSNRQPKNMDDIFAIMQSVDSKLSTIAKSNDNLSKYVDEIRSSDIGIRKK
jgi:hypothetical protein